MDTNETSFTKSQLIGVWIHCVTQLIMVGTVIFYFEHLEGYFVRKLPGMKLPLFTYHAIHLRDWLWLIPIVFMSGASWMSFRKRFRAVPTEIFNACSVLVLVSTISF